MNVAIMVHFKVSSGCSALVFITRHPPLLGYLLSSCSGVSLPCSVLLWEQSCSEFLKNRPLLEITAPSSLKQPHGLGARGGH